MEVAADRPRVAGSADVADDLADVDEVPLLEGGRMDQVGVEVLAGGAELLDDDEVPVETPVVSPLRDRPAHRRGERGAATGRDVEALVAAAAVPRGVELADRAPGAVRAADREEVAVELHRARVPPAAARDGDSDPVGPVGDQSAAVAEAIPPRGPVRARLDPGDVDRPNPPA